MIIHILQMTPELYLNVHEMMNEASGTIESNHGPPEATIRTLEQTGSLGIAD